MFLHQFYVKGLRLLLPCLHFGLYTYFSDCPYKTSINRNTSQVLNDADSLHVIPDKAQAYALVSSSGPWQRLPNDSSYSNPGSLSYQSTAFLNSFVGLAEFQVLTDLFFGAWNLG